MIDVVWYDLLVIALMSIITFFVYGIDKHLAYAGKTRVPEAVLLILAFLAGAFGALCGMILFNHKTRKPLFLTLVPLFLVLQLTADIILRMKLFHVFS